MEMDQTVLSAITAVFSSGVTYGILKAKVEALEKRVEQHESADLEVHSKFVTFQHFDSVTGSLREAVIEIRNDIKEILHLLLNKKD